MSADVQKISMDYEYIMSEDGSSHLMHKNIDVSVRVGHNFIDLEFLAYDGDFERRVKTEELMIEDEFMKRAIQEAEKELKKLGFEESENGVTGPAVLGE